LICLITRFYFLAGDRIENQYLVFWCTKPYLSEMNYNRIKELLAAKGKTANELAAYLEKSRQMVSYWSRNVKQPDIPTLYKIADFLKLEATDLLTKKSDLEAARPKQTTPKKAAPKVHVKISRSKKKG
jgi:hypothetical protein